MENFGSLLTGFDIFESYTVHGIKTVAKIKTRLYFKSICMPIKTLKVCKINNTSEASAAESKTVCVMFLRGGGGGGVSRGQNRYVTLS